MTRLSTPKGEIEIRELASIEDMLAAEAIQAEVWGDHPHPKELLIASKYEGALAAGAFTLPGEMVGLVFSFPTRDPAAQHSQLLATRAPWRGLGIGTQLKWYQRAWCLERGVTQIRWTVDPLRAANAELNIRNLGGTARVYLPDYYGRMRGIDAGAPSDRLLLEWRLASQRVTSRLRETPPDCGYPQAAAAYGVENGRPTKIRLDLEAPQILAQLPEDFIQLCSQDLSLAIFWREQTRTVLSHYFQVGYAITGFTRSGGPAYLLEREGEIT